MKTEDSDLTSNQNLIFALQNLPELAPIRVLTPDGVYYIDDIIYRCKSGIIDIKIKI